jgi:hypothetical protein
MTDVISLVLQNSTYWNVCYWWRRLQKEKSLLCRSNYVMLTHILFHVLFAVVCTLQQTERDQVPLPMDNGPPFSLTEGAQVCEWTAGRIAMGWVLFSNSALQRGKTKLNYCDLRRFIRFGPLDSIQCQAKIVAQLSKFTWLGRNGLPKLNCFLN